MFDIHRKDKHLSLLLVAVTINTSLNFLRDKYTDKLSVAVTICFFAEFSCFIFSAVALLIFSVVGWLVAIGWLVGSFFFFFFEN